MTSERGVDVSSVARGSGSSTVSSGSVAEGPVPRFRTYVNTQIYLLFNFTNYSAVLLHYVREGCVQLSNASIVRQHVGHIYSVDLTIHLDLSFFL